MCPEPLWLAATVLGRAVGSFHRVAQRGFILYLTVNLGTLLVVNKLMRALMKQLGYFAFLNRAVTHNLGVLFQRKGKNS